MASPAMQITAADRDALILARAIEIEKQKKSSKQSGVRRYHPAVHPLAYDAKAVDGGVLLKNGNFVENAMIGNDGVVLLDHQKWPEGNWWMWITSGGRFGGKTMSGRYHVIDHLRKYGNRARVGIMAVNKDVARKVNMFGVSGICAKDGYGAEFPEIAVATREAWHKDGGYVQFLSASNLKELDGPEFSLIWIDELGRIDLEYGKQPYDLIRFTLRAYIDDPTYKPRIIVTTTPKQSNLIQELSKMDGVVVTRGATCDNPFCPPEAAETIYNEYKDVPVLLDSEYYGKMIQGLPDAYWQREHFQYGAAPADLKRVAVAVDPSIEGGGNGSKTGIAVGGYSPSEKKYWVRHVESMKGAPEIWAQRVVGIYYEYGADRIIVETNNGGDFLVELFKSINPNIFVEKVTATRGKEVRAERPSLQYAKGLVVHERRFEDLENAMCVFPKFKQNLDELDAVVWLLTKLAGLQVNLINETYTGEELKKKVNEWKKSRGIFVKEKPLYRREAVGGW